MPDRIFDFAEEPVYLSVRMDNIVIQRKDKPEVMVPVADVAVIVASHPQVTYTHAVLARLATAGGVFVTCDARRHPVGMMLPLEGHSTQVERMARQVNAAVPTKKRLWQQIVRAKVISQAATLQDLRGTDVGIGAMVAQVRSGDTDNIEAQAARRYWPVLFNNPDFRRDRAAPDANRFLNYGYAILRAIVARSICAAGLHPSVGLHHHNRYSGYPLADDLMEPFRVIVDRSVIELVDTRGADAPLDRDAKQHLLEALMARFTIDAAERTLFDILVRTSGSLGDAFMGTGTKLVLPDMAALVGGGAASN